jgi:hypothetical protein
MLPCHLLLCGNSLVALEGWRTVAREERTTAPLSLASKGLLWEPVTSLRRHFFFRSGCVLYWAV